MSMNRRTLIAGTAAVLAAGWSPWPSHAQPKSGPRLKGYLRTNWSQDPFANGSYSFVAKGARRRDHRRIAEPVMGRVFFAGEAAHPKRNGTVHAALETGRTAARAILDTSFGNVAVIGAGISGLVAAHALSDAGRNVRVFEARRRIGGRINTDYSLGIPADLGASWLHGETGNPLTDVTRAAGMQRVMTAESWIARGNRKRLSVYELPDWIDEVSSVYNSAGTTSDALNRMEYLFEDDYGGDEFIFPNGYADIFEMFRGEYDLALGEAVSRISYSEDGVVVTSAAGTFEFDAVIVSVPLGVLKTDDIAFEPALPGAKRAAIERLGVGTLDKIYLQFDDVFWDEDPHWLVTPFTGFPVGHYNNWLNLHALFGQPVLVCFNGGPAALALSSETDDIVVGGALASIRSAYGLEP